MKQNKDIEIFFCPKCKWKIINPTDDEKINYCPKCKSWVLEISQFYYYKNNKLVGKEFGISDNNEVFIGFDDWKYAKKIIAKAFKLFEKELHKKK